MSAFLYHWPVNGLCRMCSTDFIDWRYIHSWLVFSTQLVNCCPHGRRNFTCVLLSPSLLSYLPVKTTFGGLVSLKFLGPWERVFRSFTDYGKTSLSSYWRGEGGDIKTIKDVIPYISECCLSLSANSFNPWVLLSSTLWIRIRYAWSDTGPVPDLIPNPTLFTQ
jgi:hypothetical protein